MDEWINDYRAELLSIEGVSPLIIARVVQKAHPPDEQDLEMARRLTSCEVDYLDFFQISQIISADIDEAQIKEAVHASQRRFEAISKLLPEYLAMLDVRSNFSLRYSISRLNDVVHDFGVVASDQRRSDKVLNDRIRYLKLTQTKIEEALKTLEGLNEDYEVIREFEGHVEAYDRVDKAGEYTPSVAAAPEKSFDSLGQLLWLLSESVDIVRHDISSDRPRERQMNYKAAKSDVVSFGYDLHLTCSGPPLVTTPGSQFSFLCSLIFEMATGKAEQSLAGAIIKFANSREREEADENERENVEDETAYQNGNNFHSVERGVRSADSAAKWYHSFSKRPELRTLTREVALRQAVYLLNRAREKQSQYGPFIVWSDHTPKPARDTWREEYMQSQEELRKARIALGEHRRALQALGKLPK